MQIQEIFSTIQGEGYWAGTRCDFVRLYGCPVGCPWCDTGYANGGGHIQYIEVDVAQIVQQVTLPRVTISGGEPFIQPELPDLVQAFLGKGVAVAIETSGAAWLDIPEEAWVTLSPKEHISPKFPVADELWARADEVKIVISDGSELVYYRDKLENFGGLVFLQPEWGKKDSAIKVIMDIMAVQPSYRLSLQTHKFAGIP